MSTISVNALIELALDLSRSLVEENRFERLLSTIRKTINCDAVALLSHQGSYLKPLAIEGISRDTLGRRFVIEEHPRFLAICNSNQPLRFDTDSTLPDPYDGLLLAMEGDLPIHSCMGLPLIFDSTLIGVLTLDSLRPNDFDDISQKTLDIISTMAAASLKTALTLELLEQHANHAQALVENFSQQALAKVGAELIGESSAMNKLKEDIQMVANSDFTALILGETGVGKELVARTIHLQSTRNQGPLIYVNCAALPENLIESELFGHVKGAFTGAHKNREGKFSLANEGSLFLDEIGELPINLQSKILRALQNQEIQPVGQDQIQQINVRVIAATNRDLLEEVKRGRFRADLYHRLSVFPIQTPPLRDRLEDIPLLVGFFVENTRRKLGIPQIKINSKALEQLQEYNWPGNVRELEHCISRAALRARSQQKNLSIISIAQEHLGELTSNMNQLNSKQVQPNSDSKVDSDLNSTETQLKQQTLSLKTATENYQRQLIQDVLKETQGNWSATARQLQVDRGNLNRLAKRLGIKLVKKLDDEMFKP